MKNEYPQELLRKLYRTMLRIRICEESLVPLILDGEVVCPVHLYTGQEAVAAGLCASLKKTDYVFGNHRSHGHFIATGGKIDSLVAEILGKPAGCSRGMGGSMHIIDPDCGMMGSAPIVSGTISLALGSALAACIRKDKRISVCFFGDGATGEGVLFESLNFAALRKLPLLFVCENNLYATHMPVGACRPEHDICEIAKPFGIETVQVDGNDVLAVYETGKTAMEKCRNGEGPVFVECMTYRLRGHVGPDDNIQGTHTDIRPKEEVKAWRRKDPIVRFEEFLLRNMMDDEALAQIRREVEEEVNAAHRFARRSPGLEAGNLEKYVYR